MSRRWEIIVEIEIHIKIPTLTIIPLGQVPVKDYLVGCMESIQSLPDALRDMVTHFYLGEDILCGYVGLLHCEWEVASWVEWWIL